MTGLALSDDQRAEGRGKAVLARRRRAEVKNAVRAGEMSFGDVLALAEEDEQVAKISLVDLLQCLPRVGPVRAQQVMERRKIPMSRRLSGLSGQQRRFLQEFVNGDADVIPEAPPGETFRKPFRGQGLAQLPVVKEWVLANEAAEIAGVSRQYIYKHVHLFKSASQLSGSMAFRRDEIEEWAATRLSE